MDGLQLIRDIAAIFKTHDNQAQIISASVRNACHVIECAKAGADLATVPYSVIEQMLKHPLTAEGIEKIPKRLSSSIWRLIWKQLIEKQSVPLEHYALILLKRQIQDIRDCL